jgi:hypothetical protein
MPGLTKFTDNSDSKYDLKNISMLVKKKSWEKMIEKQLVQSIQTLQENPVGTIERSQFIELFTFWLKELLCIHNVCVDWVS